MWRILPGRLVRSIRSNRRGSTPPCIHKRRARTSKRRLWLSWAPLPSSGTQAMDMPSGCTTATSREERVRPVNLTRRYGKNCSPREAQTAPPAKYVFVEAVCTEREPLENCCAPQLFGIPVVITFHALGRVRRLHQRDADQFPDERIDIEDRTVEHADAIIAECPQDCIDLISLYGAERDKHPSISGGPPLPR